MLQLMLYVTPYSISVLHCRVSYENGFRTSNVFIDTLTTYNNDLEGDAPRLILYCIGDHDYTIPGAIASDGSTGYSSSDYSTTIDGTLDPDIIGSTVTYYYTAHADAAGNLGQVCKPHSDCRRLYSFRHFKPYCTQ